MCQSRDFFVLNCLFLTVLSQDGLPQNVSLQWINDFEQKVTWEPPQHPVTNCSYELTAVSTYKHEIEKHLSATSPLSLKMVMHGGFLNVSVNSSCIRYEPVPSSSVTYPDLVKDLQCFITTPTEAHCIWKQTAHTPSNLGFFYHLNNNVIKECPSYVSRDRVRTGCDLEANAKDSIVLSFNGTLNKQTVRNTFKKALIRNVRPTALQWNVTKSGGQFKIHWTPPSIKITWKYFITYKECNEKKTLGVVDGVTTEFTFVPKCSYRITIQACGRLDAKTLLSDEKYFAAESDLNAWVYVAIILPLMVAVLAVLTIVYCGKNKEILFPKVPQPRDLISDISDNNNTVCVFLNTRLGTPIDTRRHYALNQFTLCHQYLVPFNTVGSAHICTQSFSLFIPILSIFLSYHALHSFLVYLMYISCKYFSKFECNKSCFCPFLKIDLP